MQNIHAADMCVWVKHEYSFKVLNFDEDLKACQPQNSLCHSLKNFMHEENKFILIIEDQENKQEETK